MADTAWPGHRRTLRSSKSSRRWTDRSAVRQAPPVSKEGAALDKQLQAVCDEALALVRGRLEKVTLAELAKGK
jgi:hypothetical protein